MLHLIYVSLEVSVVLLPLHRKLNGNSKNCRKNQRSQMLEVRTQAMRLVSRAQEPFEPAQQEQLSFATVLAPRVSTEATVATWVASHFG